MIAPARMNAAGQNIEGAPASGPAAVARGIVCGLVLTAVEDPTSYKLQLILFVCVRRSITKYENIYEMEDWLMTIER